MPAKRKVTQRQIDQIVFGCMHKDSHSLHAALTNPKLVNAASSLGFTVLFGACYVLWPAAVEQLLAAGADPYTVGLGTALDAVETGVRDASGGGLANKRADAIRRMLARRGLRGVAVPC